MFLYFISQYDFPNFVINIFSLVIHFLTFKLRILTLALSIK